MAQRAIVWALVAFALGYGAMTYAPWLAGIVNDDGPSVAVAAPALASRSEPASKPTLTVAADYRGHFFVHPEIDNYRIKMVVDTGASYVALTADDARALGIRLAASDYKVGLSTANGTVRGARVTLREVRLGAIIVRNVDAIVLPAGALSMSLLGNSFLGKLQGYEVQTGRLVLRG